MNDYIIRSHNGDFGKYSHQEITSISAELKQKFGGGNVVFKNYEQPKADATNYILEYTFTLENAMHRTISVLSHETHQMVEKANGNFKLIRKYKAILSLEGNAIVVYSLSASDMFSEVV